MLSMEGAESGEITETSLQKMGQEENFIMNIPFEKFSIKDFEKTIKDFIRVYERFGSNIPGLVKNFEDNFNVRKLEGFVESSKSSDELNNKLQPFLKTFWIFSDQTIKKDFSIFFKIGRRRGHLIRVQF